MYLATVFVNLDLEPEVSQVDRERLLRSIRDRLKQNFGSRVTVRTNDDCAIVVALLDDHYGRSRGRLDEIVDRIDSYGEARIESSHAQVFAWYDGTFQETRVELNLNDLGLGHTDRSADRSLGSAANLGSRNSTRPERTIVYGDEDDTAFAGARAGAPRSGFTRRSLRIPTRK